MPPYKDGPGGSNIEDDLRAARIFYRDGSGNQREAQDLDELVEDGLGWVTRSPDSALEDTSALERAARRWGKAAFVPGGAS